MHVPLGCSINSLLYQFYVFAAGSIQYNPRNGAHRWKVTELAEARHQAAKRIHPLYAEVHE